MFGTVMGDPECCKPFLETILGTKIQKIEYPERQKVIDIAKGMLHPAKDAEGNAYLNEIRKGMDDFLDEILKRDL